MGDRPAYVLSVEPISPSKFLYKGKIWVDAAEFAVAKMEVQPANNPSFWISRTLIHHTNGITNGFWLPEQNRSETKGPHRWNRNDVYRLSVLSNHNAP